MTYVLEKDEFDDQPMPTAEDLALLRAAPPFAADMDLALGTQHEERWGQALLDRREARKAELAAQAEQIAAIVTQRVVAQLKQELLPDIVAALRQQPKAARPVALDDAKQTLAEALNELPERMREVVRLRDFEGRSADEVAGILGVSNVTVAKLHQRGRTLLVERIKRTTVREPAQASQFSAAAEDDALEAEAFAELFEAALTATAAR